MSSYKLKYHKMKATELQDENGRLRRKVEMLEKSVEEFKERVKNLHTHIEQQRAEMMILKNRQPKSAELKKIFEKPKPRHIESMTIDNRNQQ